MRTIILVMLMTCAISTIGKAQQWQTTVSLDTRFGYSTNSYLNPFLAEWNSSIESGFNLTSAILQSYWHRNNNSLSVTGGFLFEPVFSQNKSWKGGLGLLDYNYRLSSSLSTGVEFGTSYFSGPYSRLFTWVQPKVTWFVSPFTLFRLKAGTNFQNYENYQRSPSGYSRYDLYSLEFETWPTYHWQLSAGLYGSLDTLPEIQKGFNLRTKLSYFLNNGASISLNAGLQQYQTENTEQSGGGPPIGMPGNQQTTVVVDTDRLLRLGTEASVPINKRFSVFGAAEVLTFRSQTAGLKTTDYKISGGVRFSFQPKIGGSNSLINPTWEINQEAQQVSIHYSGEGRLYLVGEFNDWEKTGIPLRNQSDSKFVAEVELSPGAYEYKVLLIKGDTEEWLPFSDETYTVDDGFGSQNAILLVE